MSDRIQQMIRLYMEDGLSYTEIGERFKLSRQRVHQLIGKHVDSARPARALTATVQELAASHARVMRNETTLAQEAQRLGYASESSLRGVMARNGLLFAGRPKRERDFAPHGTAKRYRQECRCDECRAANTKYNAALRETGEAPNHGTESGYRNYGCRCVPCSEAARRAAWLRRSSRRRKQRVAA